MLIESSARQPSVAVRAKSTRCTRSATRTVDVSHLTTSITYLLRMRKWSAILKVEHVFSEHAYLEQLDQLSTGAKFER